MAGLPAWIFRFRYALCSVIVGGALLLAPRAFGARLDNDIGMWISEADPVYQAYENFRDEFGGQRTLLIALQSDRLFTPEGLTYIQQVTDAIARIAVVDRVSSLATATVVRSLPPDPASGEEGGLDVQPLLDDGPSGAAAATRVRDTVLGDPLLRGDLASADATVTALVVSFDERRLEPVRSDVIARIHQLVESSMPAGMRAFYNGNLELTETYNRISVANARNLTPPVFLLTVGAIFFLFRSWRVTAIVVLSAVISATWTMGLYVAMGFTYNILSGTLLALIMILAIADDVHIVQHFTDEWRATGTKAGAFTSCLRHLAMPLLGASATTALGLASLATSNVVAVRSFGIGAAVGVMVDFAMSLVFVPTLLMFLTGEPREAPQERYLVTPMRRLAAFSIRHARLVAITSVLLTGVSAAGIIWLKVDTNHINFFPREHPLVQSARVLDRDLSGIYSFNVLLEGEPGAMKSPDTLRRMEALRVRLERLPAVRKVVSLADYVKRVHRELHGGDPAMAVLPDGADAIAQELFVFELSEQGREELQRLAASDYSKAQVAVRLASTSSDTVFEEINRAEEDARQVFAGSAVRTSVTGSGRIFATLDHYLVVSQLSSFGTAFLTVFAVIFLVFRSGRFALLAVAANALPVAAVLGLMGWLGISLNVATIMVASVALGIVDDDTIHFIGRFKREVAGGASSAEAIEVATVHEGRASLTTACISSIGYGVMVFSTYKPTAWFGGLLALTMMVAFLAEVFVVPALITLMPRLFTAPAPARLEGIA